MERVQRRQEVVLTWLGTDLQLSACCLLVFSVLCVCVGGGVLRVWMMNIIQGTLSVFFVIKPTRCSNSTNLFCHEILHVSDSSSVHHQELIHCTLSSGLCHTAVEQDQDGTAVPSWSCSTDVYKPVWHTPFLSVQWINSWWWTDELFETCRTSWQHKFVKLMHLVGFITKKNC
jgi:hypothetical protein